MDTEGSAEAALVAIQDLEHRAKHQPGIKICIPCQVPQITVAETQLMEMVQDLQIWNHIFGNPTTLSELLEPPEEKEIRRIQARTIPQAQER